MQALGEAMDAAMYTVRREVPSAELVDRGLHVFGLGLANLWLGLGRVLTSLPPHRWPQSFGSPSDFVVSPRVCTCTGIPQLWRTYYAHDIYILGGVRIPMLVYIPASLTIQGWPGLR